MEYVSKREGDILRKLSSNSRATITEIAKVAGCSRVTATKELRRIEEKYGLRYTLELDEEKLGTYERHILAIKFAKKVDMKAISDFFSKEGYAHEVFLTEGDFDIIVYARATDPISYIKWETYVASELSVFEPTIKPSEFVIAHFGYMPLNDGFIDDIKDKGIKTQDKKLLKALNQNSRLGYRQLAEITGMRIGNIRYHLFQLQKNGIIKRFTIAAQRPHLGYAIAYFVNYKFNKNTQERSALARSSYMNADDEGVVFNTFQLLAPLSGSHRFFAIGLFKNKQEAMEKAIESHRKIFSKENVDISNARIIRMLKGLSPFRNLDIRSNYVVINWK